jgi:hypothetical protein
MDSSRLKLSLQLQLKLPTSLGPLRREFIDFEK